MTTWAVYDGDQLVLTVTDAPGPLRSTAHLPPFATPAQHPFLTGTAHSASHEPALARALDRAASTAAFLDALRDQGLRIEPTDDA